LYLQHRSIRRRGWAAGVVVFFTLLALGVPFPLLWALWVALVDFLLQVGGALAGIPTVLFALGHSLRAGIVWSGDLPRQLQQLLFDTADSIVL
jgi:hypothetical protein